MNVLIQAASHGIRVEGATLYSTSFPCSLCAKMIINGGIRRVVAMSDYADQLAKELLREAKIRTEIFDEKSRKTKPFPLGNRAGRRPKTGLDGAAANRYALVKTAGRKK
jgi:deoxycytidylate deaminase